MFVRVELRVQSMSVPKRFKKKIQKIYTKKSNKSFIKKNILNLLDKNLLFYDQRPNDKIQ